MQDRRPERNALENGRAFLSRTSRKIYCRLPRTGGSFVLQPTFRIDNSFSTSGANVNRYNSCYKKLYRSTLTVEKLRERRGEEGKKKKRKRTTTRYAPIDIKNDTKKRFSLTIEDTDECDRAIEKAFVDKTIKRK